MEKEDIALKAQIGCDYGSNKDPSQEDRSQDGQNNTEKETDNKRVEDRREGREDGEMSRDDIKLLVVCCLLELLTQVFMSLLGPFFAEKAEKKGVDSFVVGCTFSVVPLVELMASPFFGTYLKSIGVKFMLVTGAFSIGYCNIIFGFVDWIEDPTTYTILCLLVRAIEGIATAAVSTATYAVIAYRFPDRLASMSAIIEVMSGIGFTAGPPIGGLLYEVGGFFTPFASTGVLVMIVGAVTWFIVPPVEEKELKPHVSRWWLLVQPLVLTALFNHMSGILVLGFITSRAGVWVECVFGASPLRTGVIFLGASLSYLFSSVIFGALGERYPSHGPVFISSGYILAAIAILFLGPPPNTDIENNLMLFIPALATASFGLASNLIAFQILGTQATTMYGYSLDISGWVGGVITVSFSLGEFLGPLTAGYFQDVIGFQWSCVLFSLFIASLALIQVFVFVAYKFHERTKGK